MQIPNITDNGSLQFTKINCCTFPPTAVHNAQHPRTDLLMGNKWPHLYYENREHSSNITALFSPETKKGLRIAPLEYSMFDKQNRTNKVLNTRTQIST